MLFGSSLFASAALVPTGTASGFSLTFDGRGSDIATVKLSADAFRGASGLTVTTWVRAFGVVGSPFRPCLFMMNSREGFSSFGSYWSDGGRSWSSILFGSTTPKQTDNPNLHIDAFRHWRHLAVTWSPAGIWHTYVDGMLVASEAGVREGYNVSEGTKNGMFIAIGAWDLSHEPSTFEFFSWLA